MIKEVVTISIKKTTKERVLGLSKKQSRSFSQMVDLLLEETLDSASIHTGVRDSVDIDVFSKIKNG